MNLASSLASTDSLEVISLPQALDIFSHTPDIALAMITFTVLTVRAANTVFQKSLETTRYRRP